MKRVVGIVKPVDLQSVVDNMAVRWLGHGKGLYCKGPGSPKDGWNESVDFWHCDECDGELWSMPMVQKCLRKDFKCFTCEEKRNSDLNGSLNKFNLVKRLKLMYNKVVSK